ncbi:MAG: class I SAM-dependent methyltransferase [Lachnospiraceae bacterium]|nr:class I SAM-dependent methyltransferase [Lachnospiraceae bacterium]
MKKRDFRFDNRAEKYDYGFEGKLSRKFYKLIYDNISLKPGQNLIDVGCGTGTILKTLSNIENINGHGIDIEPQMLSVAKDKCPDMDIRECSCDKTPYDDDSFDVMTACMAYHHFADKDAFIREASRILKSGGILYLADPRFPFLPRKIINALVYGLNGEFNSSKETVSRFAKYGFVPVDTKYDHYAQLIVLRKA